MASRTGLFGSIIAFSKLRAAQVNEIPDGWLGDNADGSGTVVATSQEDLVTVVVDVNASRKLKISARASITSGATADGGNLFIEEGSTDLGRVHRHTDGAGESFAAGWVTVDDPSAGSHTYKLVAVCDSSGTFTIFGDAQILVEDIGPAEA